MPSDNTQAQLEKILENTGMFTTVDKDTLKFEIVGGNKIKLKETVEALAKLIEQRERIARRNELLYLKRHTRYYKDNWHLIKMDRLQERLNKLKEELDGSL